MTVPVNLRKNLHPISKVEDKQIVFLSAKVQELTKALTDIDTCLSKDISSIVREQLEELRLAVVMLKFDLMGEIKKCFDKNG